MTFPVARTSAAVQGKLAALVAAATLDRALVPCGLAPAAAPPGSAAMEYNDARVKQAEVEPTMRRTLGPPLWRRTMSDSRQRVRARSRRIMTMRRLSSRLAHTRVINRRQAALGLCLIHSDDD